MTRDTSSTSEISCACDCALRATISSTFGMRAASTRRSRSSDTQPRMALSGVRSSCDSVARNSSFSRLARSASSRARSASWRDDSSATSTSRSSYCRRRPRSAARTVLITAVTRIGRSSSVTLRITSSVRSVRSRGLAAIVAGEEQQRHVRPGRLGLQRRRQLVDARVGQRLLGQQHGARARAGFPGTARGRSAQTWHGTPAFVSSWAVQRAIAADRSAG